MTRWTSFRSLALFLVATACGSSRPPVESASPEAAAPVEAAVPAAPAACIPADQIAESDDVAPQWRTVVDQAGTVAYCLVHSYAEPARRIRSCWRFGSDGTLTATPVPAVWNGSDDPRSEAGPAVVATDGMLRARADDQEITFSDGGDQPVKRLPLYTDDPDSVLAAIESLYLVGDTLFAVDADAGPHADVHGFRANGPQLGIVIDEIYNGGVSLLDEHRIAFAAPGLVEVAVYDTRSRAMTRLRRKVAPIGDACTDYQRDDYLMEPSDLCDEPREAEVVPCCAAMAERYGDFMQATVAPLADGGFLVLMTGSRLGQAVELGADGALRHPRSLLCGDGEGSGG